jgi:thioredoxin 1
MEILNNENFSSYVNKEENVIINFSADWCGPCKMMKPLLEKFSSEHEGRLAKIDVDQSPEIAAKYNIKGIPTFIVFKKGEVVEKKAGVVKESELTSFL